MWLVTNNIQVTISVTLQNFANAGKSGERDFHMKKLRMLVGQAGVSRKKHFTEAM